ncbi:thermostable hemolysin, partial [Pseudomonas sp. REP124]|nr:thermostable hemolysin [Pseudomonas sp. REP124]
MPFFDWNIPLPLHFGDAETPQLSLERALPDDPQR